MYQTNAEIRGVAAGKKSGESGLHVRRHSRDGDSVLAEGAEVQTSSTLVTRDTFHDVMEVLYQRDFHTVDTECTGLRPYHGDKIFSIQIGNREHAYYFNFRDTLDDPDESILPLMGSDYHWLLVNFFVRDGKTYEFHNAKYDLAMLKQDFGITVRGRLHDTMVCERILDSTLVGKHGDLAMAKVAPRYGVAKDDTVKKYIDEHKLFTKVDIPGKQKQVKLLHFDKVPHKIIMPYGCTDITTTAVIGASQRSKLWAIDETSPHDWPKIADLYANEMKLVRTVYDMERRGVRIDTDFVNRAIVHEDELRTKLLIEFEHHAGEPYKASPKLFERIFAGEKDKWVYGKPTPKKGEINPKFDKDTVATFDHPAARVMGQISGAKSRLDNYRGFLYHADGDNHIHASFNQHEASTGRFSSSEPNLQNMKKSEDDDLLAEFVVRRSIVPDPDHWLGMIDYDQVEYRLMLEYCNAKKLIRKIRDEGLDVHGATAELAGISRQKAKNGNFATLYGAGVNTLAKTIKGSELEAKRIIDSINRAAPEINVFTKQVKDRVKDRGYIFTWFGRRLDYPFVFDKKRKRRTRNEYKGPNGLIQGGCADIIKIAMNRCEAFLAPHKTELRMTIHDELVFHGPRGEEELLLECKKIMESVYPWKHIPLTAGVEISYKSLADKEAYGE